MFSQGRAAASAACPNWRSRLGLGRGSQMGVDDGEAAQHEERVSSWLTVSPAPLYKPWLEGMMEERRL